MNTTNKRYVTGAAAGPIGCSTAIRAVRLGGRQVAHDNLLLVLMLVKHRVDPLLSERGS